MEGQISLAIFKEGIDNPPVVVSCDGYVLVAWGETNPQPRVLTVEPSPITEVHQSTYGDLNDLNHAMTIIARALADSTSPAHQLMGKIVQNALENGARMIKELHEKGLVSG